MNSDNHDHFCNHIIDRVSEVLRNTLREFTNGFERNDGTDQAVAYFDFAHLQLLRPGRRPEKLEDVLHIRMLRQFFRQATLSPASYLLIPRSKLSGKPSIAIDPGAAFRHDFKRLCDWIVHGVLPITFVRNRRDGPVRLRFDPAQIDSNVLKSARKAAQAARLYNSNEPAAAALAADALAVDPDSRAAVRVLINIAKRQPDCLTRDDILRAEICVARAILQFSAAILRLNRPGAQGNSYAIRARGVAARHLDRLFARWPILQALPFSDSPSDCSGKDPHRDMLGAIVGMAATARAGISLATRRFGPRDAHIVDRARLEFESAHARVTSDSVIADMAERLIARRLLGTDHKFRAEAAQSVAAQLSSALLTTGHLPVSTTLDKFKDEFITTFERRIDWSFLNRNGRRNVPFRDDLYQQEEADDDEPTNTDSDD